MRARKRRWVEGGICEMFPTPVFHVYSPKQQRINSRHHTQPLATSPQKLSPDACSACSP